jgi:hypothetical protein
MSQIERTPLGVMPRYRHDELRAAALAEAIARYANDSLKRNAEIIKPWLKELTELVNRQPSKEPVGVLWESE